MDLDSDSFTLLEGRYVRIIMETRLKVVDELEHPTTPPPGSSIYINAGRMRLLLLTIRLLDDSYADTRQRFGRQQVRVSPRRALANWIGLRRRMARI